MNLTPNQRKMIAAFLEEADRSFRSLPALDRADALAKVRTGVQREIRALGDGPPEDDQVAEILDRARDNGASTSKPPTPHTPATSQPEPEPAPQPRPDPEAEALSGLSSPDRRWLGVCLELSERTGVELLMVRIGFLLFGLATGPVAVMLYIALFAYAYITSNDPEAPSIDIARLLSMIAGTIAGAAALYASGRGFLWAAHEFFPRFMGKPLELGEWAWLELWQGSLIRWSIMLLLPLAILAGLPMINAWDRTWQRVVQAGLALYLVAISFGIASAIVGITLQVIEEFFA